jgi:hypothetical protein
LLHAHNSGHAQRGYLREWLHDVAFASSASALRADFPAGLQLTELTASLRDGFAMLVVPILRATSPCTITAYTRQSTKMLDDEPLWDLRIKVAKVTGKQAADSHGRLVEQPDEVRAAGHRAGTTVLDHGELDAMAAESKPFDLPLLDLPGEDEEEGRRSTGDGAATATAGSAKQINVADLISQKLNAFRDEDD